MNEIKEICVSRIDRMGDMILSLPVIKAIKVVNPNIKITIFSSHKNSKILEGLQYIDTINVINTNCMAYQNMLEFLIYHRNQREKLHLF